MKKIFYLWMLFAASVGFTACSSDDEDEKALTLYNEVKADYMPIAYESAPAWLKPMIDEMDNDYAKLTVCRGKWNGKVIYNVLSYLSSSAIGCFYYEDGSRLPDEYQNADLFTEAKNWTCIIWHK